MRHKLFLIFLVVVISFTCSKEKVEQVIGRGSIIFTANGEDFIREGFTDKNGWEINFKYFYINISEPTAYMPDNEGQYIKLGGDYWIDFMDFNSETGLVYIDEITDVPAGNYQSLKFGIRKTSSGEYNGYSIVMQGEARKERETVPFIIMLDEELDFDGKEGYVGDEVKGLLLDGKSTAVEMNFHVDHIFGDIDADKDSHVNTESVGFDFFNNFKIDNEVIVTQSEMKEQIDYEKLVNAVWTLGHLGEGHCEASNQSSAGIFK